MKRKRDNSVDDDIPEGWAMHQQPSGGKIYTHATHGRVRSLAAVMRVTDQGFDYPQSGKMVTLSSLKSKNKRKKKKNDSSDDSSDDSSEDGSSDDDDSSDELSAYERSAKKTRSDVRDPSVPFVLPSGWEKIEDSEEQDKVWYISPNGSTCFRSLLNVENFIIQGCPKRPKPTKVKNTLHGMMRAGIIEAGDISVMYKKIELIGELLPNGNFKKKNEPEEYTSASSFVLSMVKSINPTLNTINGWTSLKYKGVNLNDIRNQYKIDKANSMDYDSDYAPTLGEAQANSKNKPRIGKLPSFVLPKGWSVTVSGKYKHYVSPDGSKKFPSTPAVKRYLEPGQSKREWTPVVRDIPCPLCVPGSLKRAGHVGIHATFALPEGWIVDSTTNKTHKIYIAPGGVKKCNTLGDVEKFVNSTPCPECVKHSGKIEGHRGNHVTFLLPKEWKIVETVGKGSTNTGVKSRHYISPDGNKKFASKASVRNCIYVFCAVVSYRIVCVVQCTFLFISFLTFYFYLD